MLFYKTFVIFLLNLLWEGDGSQITHLFPLVRNGLIRTLCCYPQGICVSNVLVVVLVGETRGPNQATACLFVQTTG